jgi:thiol reductant ABC exporter CydC subunit
MTATITDRPDRTPQKRPSGNSAAQRPAAFSDRVTAAQSLSTAPTADLGQPGVRSRLRTVSAGLLGGLAGAAGIALTATAGWLIVSAAARPVILTLLTAIVAVRTFGIARPALRYAERLRSHDTALTDLTRRRVALYAALIPLTPARLGRRRRADLLTGLVSDLDDEVDAQIRVAVPLIATAVGAVIATAVCTALLPGTGVVLCVMVLGAASIGTLDYLLERRGQVAVVASRARAAATATLIADNVRALRAIGAEHTIMGRLADDQRGLRRAVARQSTGRSSGVGLTVLLVAAATAIVAMVAMDAWRSGIIGAPVAALLTLTPIALGEVLTVVPDAVGALARSQAARGRIRAMLAQIPAVVGDGPQAIPPGSAAPAIRLRSLTASWTGARIDVGPVDLDIAPGEHVVLCGPNGSGKSTLLAVVARQLDPTGGSYLFGEHEVTALDLESVRNLIAVLDDEPYVFATTVRENIRLARPGCSDAEITDAVAAAGLSPWLNDLAHGLDTVLGAGGRGMSGGERTRLGLARALVSGRPVVLIDEPVAHLDHSTALAVLKTVTAALRGRSVVMVSHREDGRQLFDRVIAWD